MQKLRLYEGPVGHAAIKDRFLAINRERLRRAQEAMRDRQRDFLDILPLLFHVNHPSLPGFVSKDTPVGVTDYTPSKRCLQTVAKISKEFEFKRRVLPTYSIQSLFLMGSGGTIAYSDGSDFDIWICHKPRLSLEQLSELRKKADLIERWAGTAMDLEVHFFLVDPVKFREGEHEDLSKESSGTAQHYMLLEEFYRTSLLLAGSYPLWWMVPMEEEANYEDYVRELKKNHVVRESEYIDFGGIAGVPAEEFFGAALWQLFKSIDSPFKSVLKLMLMEAYASEYPRIDLLCLRYKKAIYDGTIDLNRLDPYIMLFDKLEEHLNKRNEPQRLEFMRRCFYFKVDQRMSLQDAPGQRSWQREYMRSLIESWGWGQGRLQILDARSKWRMDRVKEERKIMVDELTRSYQFLSSFAREYARLISINQEEMTILGRKLYAAFERKAGKVEIVNRGISDDLWENQVSLHQLTQKNDQEGWVLYRGSVPPGEAAQGVLLKHARSIMELLAWAYFNGVMDSKTAIVLYVNNSELSVREINGILATFSRYFPVTYIYESSIESLKRPAKMAESAIFVNVGIDPMEANARRHGMLMTSNRTDALSYSGLAENLALTCDHVLVTSWKEVLVFRYVGAEGLLNCLSNYLQWLPANQRSMLPEMKVHCFSSLRGQSIAKRVRQLFSDVVAGYYENSMAKTLSYVLAIEQRYYVLQMQGDVLRHRKMESYKELLNYFGSGKEAFGRVVIDQCALHDTLLPLVFKLNRPGVIQLVFQANGSDADVYVVDEMGSLHYQRTAFFNGKMLLNQFSLFFNSILKRRRHLDIVGEYGSAPIEVECYEVVRERGDKVHVIKHPAEKEDAAHRYFKVQVIGDLGEDGRPHFTIYCNDVEFSSLDYGGDLYYRVAEHILRQRHGWQRYPIYITDVDVPAAMLGEAAVERIQTVHFLNYKKQVEQQLNEVLQIVNVQGRVG